jgi:Holliday junction resolvase-like predicted endonuclease
LGFNVDRVGRYWGAKTGEIDIVAIDSENGNIVLGECKYSTTQKGLSVLHDP